MTSEEARDSCNNSWGVDTLTLEFFHDVQEVVVDLRLVAELVLDLIQVGEGIFNFKSLEVRTVGIGST